MLIVQSLNYDKITLNSTTPQNPTNNRIRCRQKMRSSYCAILFGFIITSTTQENNVCKYITDYLTINYNRNCWHNPDVGATTEQIIKNRGYPFESYDVTTEDGYVVQMFRIPHNGTNQNLTKQPILMRNGIAGSSINFLCIGDRSLPFFLVNNGFDVWMANPRGYLEANCHKKYAIKDPEFWDFSFHEVGIYDIKAEVDFVANNTGAAGRIIYLGYSMGSTESYIYASLKKDHAKENLAGIISLTPIAYLSKFGGILKVLAKFSDKIDGSLQQHNTTVIFGNFGVHLDRTFCNSFVKLVLCKYLVMGIAGFDYYQLQPEDLPVFFSIPPMPTSVKVLRHFAQQIRAGGRFQFYDYGPDRNLILYNSTQPPEYNVSEIAVPVHLFYGEADSMAQKEDVLTLYSKLKVPNKSVTRISSDNRVKFNHVDFTMAKDIETLFYQPLLKVINENLT